MQLCTAINISPSLDTHGSPHARPRGAIDENIDYMKDILCFAQEFPGEQEDITCKRPTAIVLY